MFQSEANLDFLVDSVALEKVPNKEFRRESSKIAVTQLLAIR